MSLCCATATGPSQMPNEVAEAIHVGGGGGGPQHTDVKGPHT